MAVTREELYEQVWSKPMRDVASSHCVSGSFLTRVCRRMNVPCPPAGYWAKVAAGHPSRAAKSLRMCPGQRSLHRGDWAIHRNLQSNRSPENRERVAGRDCPVAVDVAYALVADDVSHGCAQREQRVTTFRKSAFGVGWLATGHSLACRTTVLPGLERRIAVIAGLAASHNAIATDIVREISLEGTNGAAGRASPGPTVASLVEVVDGRRTRSHRTYTLVAGVNRWAHSRASSVGCIHTFT